MEKDKTPDSQAQRDNTNPVPTRSVDPRSASRLFQMQPDEFQTLRDQVSELWQANPPLGRVLENIVLHLGHSHGFDPAIEDAKARDKALKESRAQEDAQVKEDAELLVAQRAHEDAMLTTPEQIKNVALSRTFEDKQLEKEKRERAEKRAQEDEQLKNAQKGADNAI